MKDFIDHVKMQLNSDRDRILVDHAEVLIASGYPDVYPEIRRILLETSLSSYPVFVSDVETAMVSAGMSLPASSPIMREAAVSAFHRDLLDRKRDSIAQLLTEVRGKQAPA